jgi:hypothetical protein
MADKRECLTAREHAQAASQLMADLAAASQTMRDRGEDEVLALSDMATGRVKRFNKDAEWTLQTAQTHALCALALHFSGEG